MRRHIAGIMDVVFAADRIGAELLRKRPELAESWATLVDHLREQAEQGERARHTLHVARAR